MGKAKKGTVQVGAVRDRLRLRWSFGGQRHTLYLELPDSITNRRVAEAKAKLIERDMALGAFDATLEKYRSQFEARSIAATDLYEQFVEAKTRTVLPQSMTKYQGLSSYLRQYFRNRAADAITQTDAHKFCDWLSKRLRPVMVRERIATLRSCWNWAIARKVLTVNPWIEVKVRVARTQKKPFTRDEIGRIIEGFRSDCDYAYYADYVKFLLGTGCRLGEAIALRWRHLDANCQAVWFGESYYRGQFKGLKTEDERVVMLTSRLTQMLLARRPDRVSPDELIFPGKFGKPVNDHNFRNRAWKSVLAKVRVEYRRPRNTHLDGSKELAFNSDEYIVNIAIGSQVSASVVFSTSTGWQPSGCSITSSCSCRRGASSI